jgi:hypothetical protein
MSRPIVEARYTSPSGKSAVFLFEAVSRETELKTGVFTFPHLDGAHVQHQGMGARSFPFDCIFSGSNCMEEADAFEAMLIEPGIGELQHPIYGTMKVVPTGNITREDDLVARMNESIVTVTFTETIVDGKVLQLGQSAIDDIVKKIEQFDNAAVEDFVNALLDCKEEPATQWEGEIEITVSDADTVIIPIGTELQSDDNGKRYMTEDDPVLKTPAERWEGEIVITVIHAGSALPAGTELQNDATGKRYVTKSIVPLSGATVSAPVSCKSKGKKGNLKTGGTVRFVNPPSSVGGAAEVKSTTAEGKDATETVTVKCTDPGSEGNLTEEDTLRFVDTSEDVEETAVVESTKSTGEDETVKDTKSINEQRQIQSDLDTQTQSSIDNLESMASADRNIFAEWLASAKELKAGIKNLYKKSKDTAGRIESAYVKALNIARGILRLMRLPSRIAITIAEKIKGYSKLTADLINQYKNDPFGIKNIVNAYTTAKLGLASAVASIAYGSAVATANASSNKRSASSASARGESSGAPVSREEAIQSAQSILLLYETVLLFQDERIASIQESDQTGVYIDADAESFLLLSELVYASVLLIMNASFALPVQRTITLDQDRQVIELCAELYGSVEPWVIDQFIAENNLDIDEMQVIPMGRRVSYYVQIP